MGECKTSIFNKIIMPVLVVSPEFEMLFANACFQELFGEIVSMKKFQHNFSFEVCVLDNANISNYNPLSEAVSSECDFSARVTFQNHKRELHYFDFSAYKENGYTVMFFKDVTDFIKNKKLQDKFDKLSYEYKNIQTMHKQFVQLEQTSREQAIKMSVLNKISHQIKTSIHVDTIIKTALTELLSMVGGFKSYWAVSEGENFVIKQIYPEDYKKLKNTKIVFDERVNKNIFAKKYDISTCFREYKNATEKFKTPVQRILIPVYSSVNDFLGVIVLITSQKNGIKPILDIFQALSTQIATEIVQASLFKQLNDKNLELEKTLAELKETQVQLINSEKMASLGHLIAGVAHEINTPIGSINANNSLIDKVLQKLNVQVGDKNSELLSMIKTANEIDKEAIKRISKIVLSLKKFVRLDEAELQDADINSELNLTLNLIRHETKNRIKITKNYSEIPLLKCYPNMLNQAFMNILMNAIQSIEGEGEITLSTFADENNLFVKIKDTGCGMDENVKKNIFTPGFTTKGVGVGTGIGLAISYKIVEKHNGKFLVSSTPNLGSEFVVVLPIKP